MKSKAANLSPTERFSNRVNNYIRYRPDYPPELYEFIVSEFNLTKESSIVEVGSGTGIFAKPLLEKGFKVYCVEPNEEMRKAAEKMLTGHPEFSSINGSAENTTLPACIAGMIISAQAFHWFEIEKCRREFLRIRKNEKTPVLIIWNERKISTGFLKAYEDLLNKFSTDYGRVDHRNVTEDSLNKFYGNQNWQLKMFDNHQDFDRESFKGRVFSSSYTPLEGEKDHDELVKRLDEIFNKFAVNGTVRFEYDAKVYWGYLTGSM